MVIFVFLSKRGSNSTASKPYCTGILHLFLGSVHYIGLNACFPTLIMAKGDSN